MQALNNACDIPLSQLPIPCMKGDALVVKIPEDEYKVSLENCKDNLHGRVPWKVGDLYSKLLKLWSLVNQWKMTLIGKCFYEFSFASVKDMRKVLSVGSWSLAPGTLRLFIWFADFCPSLMKLTNVQC